jgi:hypothetical protein
MSQNAVGRLRHSKKRWLRWVSPRNGIAPVDAKDEKIYALTGDGIVYAFRHPAPLRDVFRSVA